MRFETALPPQWKPPASVRGMMLTVLLALAPATFVFVWFYGPGVLLNMAVATLTALVAETACLRLAGHDPGPWLLDGSAVVAAVLFALCLPPLCPWWVTATGIAFAIGFAKHLYGGLGFNLFNPAMAGYVLVLVSFPQYMTGWPAPNIGDIDYQPLGFSGTLHYTLTGDLPDGLALDAVTRATTLDLTKQGLGSMRTINEIRTSPLFGDFGGEGWEWIGNFVAMGGLALLLTRVIRWYIPASVLGGLLVPATLVWLLDPQTHASPGFHLFAGGALLGAFFIATDPVSSPTTRRGRILYGSGIGVLTFSIREWGTYPDGLAFAVLLMNMGVPLIDRYTRPRIYGHAGT